MAFKAPTPQSKNKWKTTGIKKNLWPLAPPDVEDSTQGPLGAHIMPRGGELDIPQNAAKTPLQKTTSGVAKTAQLEQLIDMLIRKKIKVAADNLRQAQELYQNTFLSNGPQNYQYDRPNWVLSGFSTPSPPPPPTQPMVEPSRMPDAKPQNDIVPRSALSSQNVQLYIPEASPSLTDFLGAIQESRLAHGERWRREFYFPVQEAARLESSIEALRQRGLGPFGQLVVSALIRAGDLAAEYEQAKETGDPALVRKTYNRLRQAQDAVLHQIRRLERADSYARRFVGPDRPVPIQDAHAFLIYLTAANLSDRARTRISGRNMLLEKNDTELRQEIIHTLHRYGREYGYYLDPDTIEHLTDRIWNVLQQDERFQDERKRYEKEKAERQSTPSPTLGSKPEAKPEIQTRSQPEPKPELKSKPKPEPKPEIQTKPQPELKPELRSKPKPEPKPELKPEPGPGTPRTYYVMSDRMRGSQIS